MEALRRQQSGDLASRGPLEALDFQPAWRRVTRGRTLDSNQVIATLREPFLVLDKTLRVQTANAAFYRTFHVTKENTEGRCISDLGNGQWNNPRLRKLLEEVLSSSRPIELEVEHDFPGIGKKIMLLHADRFEPVESRPDLILLAIEDITERKRAEVAREAEQSDLHRRKDEFLAMLSHELRNPLAPIMNAVQLLRIRHGNETPIQQQARAIIERQIGQMKHLVDELLEISRITTGRLLLHREQVAVNRIVECAVETTRPAIQQHKHDLTVSLSPQPVWLNVDAARMEQVLVNLLTNAAKYTDEGGRICLTVCQEGDACVLRVRDTGFGITPEFLPHIFDLFKQADRSLDRSQGGLGVGLCVVQRLVELHGGTVTAHSVLGQGSEFVVRLPVALSSPQPPSPVTGTGRRTPHPLRVLVVDDNVDAARSLGMLLEASGHDVRMAHDGTRAMEAALDCRPDVVLLDIGLPGLSGLEVGKRMRQQPVLEDVVLIAMTGYGRETDRQLSQEAGFAHHLTKPADFDTLAQILATVSD